MSIKSVLNNNISLQTNILESRGHYPRDVVCQNGIYTVKLAQTSSAPTIALELGGGNHRSGRNLTRTGFHIAGDDGRREQPSAYYYIPRGSRLDR